MKKSLIISIVLVISFIIGGSTFNLEFSKKTDSLISKIMIDIAKINGIVQRIKLNNKNKVEKDKLREFVKNVCEKYKIKIYVLLDDNKAKDFHNLSKIPYYYSRHRLLSKLKELIKIKESIKNEKIFKNKGLNIEKERKIIKEVTSELILPKKEKKIAKDNKTKVIKNNKKIIIIKKDIKKDIKLKVVNSDDKEKFFSIKTKNKVKKEVKEQIPFSVLIKPVKDRPIFGLSFASLIFEYSTKENIRKYLAIFNKTVPIIGPIADIDNIAENKMLEYSGLYIGMKKCDKLGNYWIDPTKDRNVFWKADFYKEPYNMFTNTDKINKLKFNIRAKSLTYGNLKIDNILYDASKIYNIKVKGTNVKYIYNENTMNYLRYENNKPAFDISVKKNINISTVILQYPAIAKGENNTGYGNASILTYGKVIEGVWIKNTENSSTNYFDRNGNPISVKEGLIWIHCLEKDNKVVYISEKNHIVNK